MFISLIDTVCSAICLILCNKFFIKFFINTYRFYMFIHDPPVVFFKFYITRTLLFHVMRLIDYLSIGY